MESLNWPLAIVRMGVAGSVSAFLQWQFPAPHQMALNALFGPICQNSGMAWCAYVPWVPSVVETIVFYWMLKWLEQFFPKLMALAGS